MSTTRIAALVKSAIDAQRRLYASRPFMERFAAMILVLASASTDSYGKALTMLMLQAGVKGMPPVNGEDAYEFAKKVRFKPERLPSNYALKSGETVASFGSKLYHEVLKKLGNPAKAEDVMMDLMAKFYAKNPFKDDFNVHQAMGLCYTSLGRDAITKLRKKDEKNDSLTDDSDEGDGSQLDVPMNENAFSKGEVARAVEWVLGNSRAIAEIAKAAKMSTEDVKVLLDLMMDGVSVNQIAEQKMLPTYHSTYQALHKALKDRVYPALNEVFRKYLPERIQDSLAHL